MWILGLQPSKTGKTLDMRLNLYIAIEGLCSLWHQIHLCVYMNMHTPAYTRVVSLYTCVCINIHVLMHAYTLCFRIGLIIKYHWGWDRHYLAQFEPHFWNAQHPWSSLLSHCSFWTSCKALYGKLRLMTKCNVLKLLKVFVFPLIFSATEWKAWKMILFFTVIICLTSQILCRQKTPSELVCWDPACKRLALSHSSIITTSCLRCGFSSCPCWLRPVNHFR